MGLPKSNFFALLVDYIEGEVLEGRAGNTAAFNLLRSTCNLLEGINHEEADLKDAIGRMVDLANRSGILHVNFETDVEGVIPMVPEAWRAVLGVLDVLLGNIILHSGAGQAELYLEMENSVARLLVVDNGCGFLVNEAMAAHPQGGLKQMQNLVSGIGCSVRIYSKPGYGCRVDLLLPLNRISLWKQAARARAGSVAGIVLINESTIFMEGLASLLNANGYKTLASIGELQEAEEAALRLKPGVIVLDTQLGGVETFSLARSLKNSLPETKFVFLTDSTQQTHLHAAISSGANAYLHSNMPVSDLLAALSDLGSEPFTLSPFFASRLVIDQVGERANLEKLSPTQMRIYELVQQRLTNKEIADRLNLSEAGVKYHMRRIMNKLSANSRGSLMRPGGGA